MSPTGRHYRPWVSIDAETELLVYEARTSVTRRRWYAEAARSVEACFDRLHASSAISYLGRFSAKLTNDDDRAESSAVVGSASSVKPSRGERRAVVGEPLLDVSECSLALGQHHELPSTSDVDLQGAPGGRVIEAVRE